MATQPPVGAQEMPLLRTKLYIPPIRPEWVLRPRLIERLDVGLGRKLTLVSAPAGFGKTTMIGEWIHRGGAMTAVPRPRGQASTTPRFAWLSLDEGDNDPTRFLTYLVAALQAAVQTAEASFGRGALSALQSPQPPPVQIILTTLINELAALPNRIVLVLDDYHLIQAQPVHDGLTFLLRHLTSPPGGLHLVIATREDPPLPLSRLRARGQLTELRATDLRFTPSEAAEFLNRVMGLDLSAEDSAALETRTEGWIAGLQLAALALQGALANQAPRQGRLGHKVSAVTGFIQSFTGSHHFVLDYLVDEVLEQQPKGIQVFLLQTVLLDRITGPLCDALTGQSSSQATLEMLDHSNLFIVPLDDERRWYRYHHLFADLLFHRLKQTQAEQLPTLQRRASEWHEKNGFVDEAIEYALRAEDFGRAAHLIEDHVDVLWGQGENNKLGRWLDGLPEQVLFSNPYISIFSARLQYLSGQLDAAERTLQAVEQALASTSSADSDSAKLRGRTAATRAGLCNFRQDVPGIIHHARQALQDLPMEDLPWRGTAAFMLGNAYGFQGNMTASCKARLEALTAFQAAGDLYYVLMTNQHIAITLRARGWLRQTIESCERQWQFAIQTGLPETNIAGWLLAVWGETLVELDDLDRGLDRAQQGFELAEKSGATLVLGGCFVYLIRVLFSRGDFAAAKALIRKMETIDRESDLTPWTTVQMAAWQARIWLAQGNLDAASQWAQGRRLVVDGELRPPGELNDFSTLDNLVLARILIAQGRPDALAGLLALPLEASRAGGHTSTEIEVLGLQALMHQAQGAVAQGIASLEQALLLAEPAGFVHVFVDEGPPMARLLYEAMTRGIMPDYAGKLLAAFPDLETTPVAQSKISVQHAVGAELVEPLSERELEVLELFAQGLTNQEIASRLFLALNMIKAHSRNIFGKLGVHSRTRAVARARALGLLDSD